MYLFIYVPSGEGASLVQLEFKVSFAGHLLDVKHWFMSKVSFRHFAAENHEKQSHIVQEW